MSAADIWFTNPKLWAGAAAVVLPAVVHLLTRRTRRLVRFPSLRFLVPARASQSALYRLRHWILWIVRTLVVACLLLAFLKPVRRERWQADAGPRDLRPAAVVIVLNVSASMAYQAAGESPFSRGRAAALRLLQGLDPRDEANVILAGAAPRASLREPAAAAYALRHDLEAARPTLERADLAAAVSEAARQLRQSTRRRRELHIVSDFQRSNWAGVTLDAVPDGVRTVCVPVGADDPSNLSIGEVLVEPATPALNEDVSVVCRVANAGSAPASVPLRLQLGEDARLERDVTVAPGMTASETFRVRVRAAGQIECTATLPADRLPVDDRRCFIIPVAGRQELLVVSDGPADAPTAPATLLRAAFDPFADGRRAFFAARAARGDALPAGLGRFAAVLLCDTRPLAPAALDALLEYLTAGGRVLWFLGARADADNLAALAARSAGRLALPFRAGNLVALPPDADATAATLAEADFDHPALRRFREHGDLTEIRFLRRFATEREKSAGKILARYGDGTIAAAVQVVGAGALLVANFSPAPDAGDLARRAAFVPLVHELVRGMKPRAGWTALFAVGEPCAVSVRRWRQDEDIRFSGPDGEALSASFDAQGDTTAVVFPPTRLDGFYRVHGGAERLGSAAVNVDRRESDLAALPREGLAALAPRAGQAVVAAAGTAAADLAAARTGTPLWPYALVAAALWLAIEQALWWAWRR